jgi:hypothetical protein
MHPFVECLLGRLQISESWFVAEEFGTQTAVVPPR